jgi:hypothetical protein
MVSIYSKQGHMTSKKKIRSQSCSLGASTYPLGGAEGGECTQELAAIRVLVVTEQSAALVLHIVGPKVVQNKQVELEAS